MPRRINEPNIQVRLRRIPEGVPKPDDLEVVEASVPVPGDAPTDGMPMASAPASAVRGGIDRDAQRLKAEALLGGLVTFPQK